jgi:hypothetical protein
MEQARNISLSVIPGLTRNDRKIEILAFGLSPESSGDA